MTEPADGTRYRIPCPHCGELIVPKSVRCRHCDREVRPPAVAAEAPAPPPAPAANDDSYRVPCPHCGDPIVPKAVECRWCGAKLDGPRAPQPPPPPVPAPAPEVDPLLGGGAPPAPAPPAAPEAERVPCPQCRELILPGAIRCRYCGSDVKAPGGAPALRRAAPRPNVAHVVTAAEERSLQSDVTRALVASILGTVCLGGCGIVLGPVMLLVAHNYRKRAARLRCPVPGTNVGITVCGVISSALGLFTVAIMFAGVFLQPATLYVDHDYAEELTVEVDGRVELVVPRDTHGKLQLKHGPHRIVVRGRSGAVAQQDVTVARGRRYLLNPGARCTYHVETARYSTTPGINPFGDEPLELPPQAWRDITGYNFVFEPFPQQIQLGKYEHTATRTRIVRAGRTY